MTIGKTSTALLLFRVGPVWCCAPSAAVTAILPPRPSTHPPGSNAVQPGIFKHSDYIVALRDLRVVFGTELAPAPPHHRIVITAIAANHYGFIVDEIIEVRDRPAQGWSSLPALVPADLFTQTLLLDDKIYLYTEFAKLAARREQGVLRHYIQQLIAVAAKPPTIESDPLTSPVTPTDHTLSHADTATANLSPPLTDLATNTKPTIQVRTAAPKATRARTAKRQQLIARPLSQTASPTNTAAPTRQSAPTAPRPSVQAATAASPIATSVSNPALTSVLPNPTMALSQTKPSAAAAVWFIVVLFVGLVGGSAYIALTSQPAPSPIAPVTSDINSSPPPPTTPDITTPTVEPSVVAETLPSPASILDSHTSGYRADISSRDDEITIILETPDHEPALFAGDQPTPSQAADDRIAAASSGNSLDKNNAEPAAPSKPVSVPTEIVHIVVKGDTLWHIAARYVNNPYRYPELAKLSNIRDPDRIYPGNKVRIIQRKKPAPTD